MIRTLRYRFERGTLAEEDVFVIQAKDVTVAAYTVDDAYRQGMIALFEPGNHVGITGSWFDEESPDWDEFWNGVLNKLQVYEYSPVKYGYCHSR